LVFAHSENQACGSNTIDCETAEQLFTTTGTAVLASLFRGAARETF